MATPNQLGQFRLEAEIGRGGMGVVYRAHDERLDRLVAIKAIAPGVAADPERMARFRREARAIAQLNHPHIAQIHQILDHDGQTYLVLEYIPGRSLTEWIGTGTGQIGLETMESLRLCSQIARALEAAHAKGIIHRDLKPDNIRVTDDGTAKVLDFGIALAGPSVGGAPSATAPTSSMSPSDHGGIIGTPGYMAPEQCRALEVDARADIFAFGCVLYECLTAERAFQGGTPADLIAATLKDRPDEGRLPSNFPVTVRKLLQRCLSRPPQDRPQSMTEVRVLLDAALGARVTADSAAVPVRADVPHNLPHPRDHFIGRVKELQEAASLLDKVRLLTLTGSGGCGKTRLAVELGRRVLGRFPGGVWMAELATTNDGAHVMQAIARALSASEEPGKALIETLVRRLSNQRALLILDNCEHILGASGSAAGTLLDECPDLRILATSREALGVRGETTWRVPSLGLPPRPRDHAATPAPASRGGTASRGEDSAAVSLLACESVALFLDRAKEARPAFELTDAVAPSVASICRRLDGIPLAIELAAARVKVLAPDQIDKHLTDRFRLLTGGKGSNERHHTLRAAVDWSYRLLTPHEQAAVRALSVFVGGWTLEGAAAVLSDENADLFEVLDLLTHLIDKSLVVVDDSSGAEAGGRYRLLETVRQYAAEKLDSAGEAAKARNRHLRFYHALSQEAREALQGSQQGAWLDRLDAELENLLEAIRWGAGVKEQTGTPAPADCALRIGSNLQLFWTIRAHYSLARDAMAAAVESARGVTSASGAAALGVLGWLSWRLRDYVLARSSLQSALAASRACRDRVGEAENLHRIGTLAFSQGDFGPGEICLEQALAINRELGRKSGIAGSLANLSIVAWNRGELDKARTLSEEALALSEELDSKSHIANVLRNLAAIACDRGDLFGARQFGIRSLTMCLELGDKARIAENLNHAGIVATMAGQGTLAARLVGAGRAAYAQAGLRPEEVEEAHLDRHIPKARAALRETTGSDETWARAEAEGEAMSVDAAARLALESLRRTGNEAQDSTG